MANSNDPELDHIRSNYRDQDVLPRSEGHGPTNPRGFLMGSEVWLNSGGRSALTSSPPLPSQLFIKTCTLRKRFTDGGGTPGWGLVLRGTTSELSSGKKVYTCYVEDVHQGSEAQAEGFKRGDQILSVDGVQVKDLNHATVVQFFKKKDIVSLVMFPAELNECTQVRVTKSSRYILPFIWALMHQMQSLEIINVKLAEKEICLGSLIHLKRLSLCHCLLTSLSGIKGIGQLQNLESLSLAHNYLAHSSFDECVELKHLQQVKKLDISRNLLSCLPEVVSQLYRLEVLIVVDNNLTEIPSSLSDLPNLHTLCLDGNLLTDVDKIMVFLPSVKNLTVSNNNLECEPQVIKNCQFLVAGVEDNPYTRPRNYRMEPTLRRTLSVRGQVLGLKKEKLTED